jgi:hypothetical protein
VVLCESRRVRIAFICFSVSQAESAAVAQVALSLWFLEVHEETRLEISASAELAKICAAVSICTEWVMGRLGSLPKAVFPPNSEPHFSGKHTP